MSMPPIFFRPGQQIRPFDIYRRESGEDEKGRVTYSPDPAKVGTLMGTISEASQSEKFQWNQQGHPITHTVTIRGRTKADAFDELRIGDSVYTIQGKHDPAELGIFTILYCLERLGVAP